MFFKLPKGLRFLIVGGYNTAFSAGSYALLYTVFGSFIPYLVLAIVNHVIGVTNAFLSYKILVFRTKNEWKNEYFRTHISYILALCINLIGLYLLVDLAKIDPRIAGVILSVFIAVISYFMHSNFSFKQKND
jgi:putative flippase GtrA